MDRSGGDNECHVENIITYEQPLHERIRAFMRLEHLFNQAAYSLRGYSVWDSRATLNGIMDILDILSRSDLKTELFKELERQQSALSRLSNTPGVDTSQLESILRQLENALQELHAVNGQLGQRLREHELLNSIRQRSSIPGGSCNFDLPGLHFWLQQEPELRINQLEQWYTELDIIYRPIALILGIIRESTVPSAMRAEQGFYQQSLDSAVPYQMIRVGLANAFPGYPEISAGKHRLTIRFMQPQGAGRAVQIKDDTDFQLNVCAI